MLHGIHCIQSCCIKSTAFNMVPFLHAACNTLHLITLDGIHCIQSGCILPRCMQFTAFNHNAWNPLHSIGMLWAMLHKIHCIQSCCMESTGNDRRQRLSIVLSRSICTAAQGEAPLLSSHFPDSIKSTQRAHVADLEVKEACQVCSQGCS